MPTSTLERVRLAFSGPLMAILWLAAVIVAGVSFVDGHRLAIPITLTAFASAGAVTLSWRSSPTGDVTRWMSAVALNVQVALLVLAMEGTHYQSDMHMAFFAVLAISAGWFCAVSIMLATVFVAVHHLVLNFLYPFAVFQEGSEFLRVIDHAVLLLVEAGALVILCRRVVVAMTTADSATDDARDALVARTSAEAQTQAMGLEVQAMRGRTEERIIETVGAIVAAAKAGDFKYRPEPSADLGRLGALVTGLNEVNASVDQSTEELLRVLSGLADGDLTRQITTAYPGRFGELKEAVNETVDAARRRRCPPSSRRPSTSLRRPPDQCRRQRPLAPYREPGLRTGADGRHDRATGRVGEGLRAVVPPGGGPRRAKPRRWRTDGGSIVTRGGRRDDPHRAGQPEDHRHHRASSTTSPSRPTCWRSTQPSRRPGPARPARASRWSRPKSARWRSAPPRPRRTSPD